MYRSTLCVINDIACGTYKSLDIRKTDSFVRRATFGRFYSSAGLPLTKIYGSR